MSVGIRLKGKVAVITGAASGIGRACVVKFAGEGASVIAADIDVAGVDDVVSEAMRTGGQAKGIRVDVTSEEQCQGLMQYAVRTYGRLDILVTTPWWHPWRNAVETSADEWRRAMAVTLDGVFYCCKHAIGSFPGDGGVIINVSSVQAFSGMPDCAAYMAAKGAVNQLTRSIAIDFGRKGIRANVVCPGIITSPPTLKSFSSAGERKQAEGHTLLGRLGSPEDVANACLFLASDEASYITGTMLVVDGGLTAFHV